METYAKIIEDSTYEDGHRLTTFEIRKHRFVLSEMNTHRVFSRNSASSRAIPVAKQLKRVRESPALPLSWPAEQKGMQGGAELDRSSQNAAEALWRETALYVAGKAERLAEVGLHKSVTNRLLEPFMWHTVVVTATSWQNFFEQRCSPLAQPEIRAVAELMRAAYLDSQPQNLENGEWHLPYVSETEGSTALQAAQISAARCARVSYLTHDGVRDIAADLDLFQKLVSAKPAHWSPLEHVATPWAANQQEGILPFNPLDKSQGGTYAFLHHLPKTGNLLGWRSLRTEVEAAKEVLTFS